MSLIYFIVNASFGIVCGKMDFKVGDNRNNTKYAEINSLMKFYLRFKLCSALQFNAII